MASRNSALRNQAPTRSCTPESSPAMNRLSSSTPIAFLKAFTLTAVTVAALPAPSVQAATPPAPQPDFKLNDTNPNSVRYRTAVSPKDYGLQISAFYFADSGCSYCRGQYDVLQRLQRDLAASNPGLNIQILGVNRISSEPYNYIIGLTPNILPWLQDTLAQSVWLNWGVTFRDVIVLDAFNRPIAKDNLTTHDLKIQANYDALKAALLHAAAPVDTDQDGLIDDWEIAWFNTLDTQPGGDPDGDGFDNLQESAFGTAPNDATSFPRMTPRLAWSGTTRVLTFSFPRFSGGLMDFALESSPDLKTWGPTPDAVLASGTTRLLYDGRGGAETHFQQDSLTATQAGFLRVRALPRSGSAAR